MNSPPEEIKQRRSRPLSRFLFDENLPWRVASALRELGYRTSYVGNNKDEAPPRGSSNHEIIDHAGTTNQVVVTSNYDMVLLCLQHPNPVVWLDHRGTNLSLEKMVILVFGSAPEWDRMLQEGALCIRALRTKSETVPADRAIHLIEQRMRRSATKKRAAAKPKPLGPLLDPE